MKKIFGSLCLLIFIFSYLTTTSFCLMTDREVVNHSMSSASYEINHTIECLQTELKSNTTVDILSLSSDTDAYNTVSITFTSGNTDLLNVLKLFNNNEEIIGSINGDTKEFIVNSKGYLNSIISVNTSDIVFPADTISVAAEVISANSDYNTGFTSTASLIQDITLIEDVINTYTLTHNEICECEECLTETHSEDCLCDECTINEELTEEPVEEPTNETVSEPVEEQENSATEEIETEVIVPADEILKDNSETEEIVEETPEEPEQTSETEETTENIETIVEPESEEIIENTDTNNTEQETPIDTPTEPIIEETIESETIEEIPVVEEEITETVIEPQSELVETSK